MSRRPGPAGPAAPMLGVVEGPHAVGVRGRVRAGEGHPQKVVPPAAANSASSATTRTGARKVRSFQGPAQFLHAGVLLVTAPVVTRVPGARRCPERKTRAARKPSGRGSHRKACRPAGAGVSGRGPATLEPWFRLMPRVVQGVHGGPGQEVQVPGRSRRSRTWARKRGTSWALRPGSSSRAAMSTSWTGRSGWCPAGTWAQSAAPGAGGPGHKARSRFAAHARARGGPRPHPTAWTSWTPEKTLAPGAVSSWMKAPKVVSSWGGRPTWLKGQTASRRCRTRSTPQHGSRGPGCSSPGGRRRALREADARVHGAADAEVASARMGRPSSCSTMGCAARPDTGKKKFGHALGQGMTAARVMAGGPDEDVDLQPRPGAGPRRGAGRCRVDLVVQPGLAVRAYCCRKAEMVHAQIGVPETRGRGVLG